MHRMAGKHRAGCLTHMLGGLALIVAFCVAGCEDPPSTGYITKMPYEGESYWYSTHCGMYHTVTSTTMVKRGNSYVASTSTSQVCIMTVQDRHVNPPKWEICLRADDDPKHKGCFEVPRDLYNKYQVGTHYPNPM